jgi:threonine dehydrogenase-like Zn-dependent dehydrogenase
MPSTLVDYENLHSPLPAHMLAWQLYGAGLENLGKNSQPVSIPVPTPADDAILVRVDAVGLCFSDVKLIRAGSSHPRISGRDLKANPTIPGHEVSVTVVNVGDKRMKEFSVGERYIVQADVFYKGENPAFGYAIPGGFAQYALIDRRMLDGDEGCYLLPVKEDLGYAEAALIEPWACVEAAYVIADRTGIKPRGTLLLVVWNGAQQLSALHEMESLLQSGAGPASLFLSHDDVPTVRGLVKTARTCGIDVKEVARPTELIGDLESVLGKTSRFDDIVLIAPPSCDAVHRCIPLLDKKGILNIISDGLQGAITIDVGAVHYRGVRVVGSDNGTLLQQYSANTRTDLKPAGAAWFVGAGGPMGQMHVQRAVASKSPPHIIVATDVDDARLYYLSSRYTRPARDKNIQFHALNPTSFNDQSPFEQRLLDLTSWSRFDDVVVMAPVVPAIEQAARFVAPNGILNVFAGVSIGTNVRVNVDIIFHSCRVIGSSGSSIHDLERTLHFAEQGLISPNESVAAIGGMRALRDGIEAVQKGALAGKVVIYPHVLDLPLTPLEELSIRMPSVARGLNSRGSWTRDAERALLKEELKG